MNRQAQAVVLLLVGGAILRASVTDLYLRYVKEGLRPFLIVAGLLLVAAAVTTLWYELRPRKVVPASGGAVPDGFVEAAEHADEHDGHGHSHDPKVAWLLVLPVFALLLVAPPALGSYAAGRSGTAIQEVSEFPPLPAGDPVRISVIDYATRAVYDDGKSLGDRKIKLSGFVLIGEDGAPYLARMVLSCCAADARPIKIGLAGAVPAGLAADSWLEVTGTYTDRTVKDVVNDGVIPYLDVTESHPIPAPHNQYEE
ncbi:membrane protein [Virgisporangium aliadipatigenens]|uniref:Membrane protein n=1 Tax=Virgisporangium aliadipatigenens TaxID=741659 RepID=A0A8J4DRJ1_9ACTN|nr:TIGR03943 family protein [Virgisporangium aliadipatigenens]GIJ47111.1 membrane protein [Virgisporangium aliadipatigenens]